MKTIGTILDALFDKQQIEIAAEHVKLHQTWNEILDEAFIGRIRITEEEADFIDDERAENYVNAAKLHEHSKVRTLKHETLIIEADHPGWVQILQNKQRALLSAVRKRFSVLSINRIRFVLAKEEKV